MAEVFFGVAWAAGVVEGGSILLHASKQQNDETRGGGAMLLVPSILYGTTALPLGVIGASPGPTLVSSFPFAPGINALLNDGLTEAAPVTNNTTNDTTNNDTKLSATKQESETLVSLEGEREPEHTIISRSEMIRKVREDNRRSLAAARQQQQHKPSVRSSSPQLIKVKRAHSPKSTLTTKLLSTLDGRPLATPLAEAMRRMRFLCVGAGLVLTMMTYQTLSQQQLEKEQALQREQRLRGRDIGAIQALLQNSNNEHGVVVRLVGEKNSLQGLTRAESNKGVVLPLVHQVDSNLNVHENLLSVGSDSAYWNLGTTPQEWKETPLTTDWLLRSSSSEDDNHSRLVLEADVSPSCLYDYLQDANRHVRLEPTSTQAIDNTMMVSRILCVVAKEKGVLSDNQGDEATVNVLVGAGPRPRWLDDTNTVYIDGSKAVGNEVSSILDRIYSTDSDAGTPLPQAESAAEKEGTGHKSELASTPPSDMPEEIPESMGDAFSLFEYVGMKLREGGTRVASAVSRVFTRGETKTVHFLSDSPVAALWLQGAMPYGWTILGYNAFEDIGLYQDVVAESGDGVTLVCCENDEATSAMVCSLLLTNAKTGASGRRLVALVQDEEYTRGLRTLATDLKNDTIIEIVSVTEVHNNLFGHARELLASGKTASEVQDSTELE